MSFMSIVACCLLAIGHGVRNVRGAGDDVTPGIEPERLDSSENRSTSIVPLGLQTQPRSAREIEVHAFADRKNHGIALVNGEFVGGHRLTPPGSVIAAKGGLHDLNGISIPGLSPIARCGAARNTNCAPSSFAPVFLLDGSMSLCSRR